MVDEGEGPNLWQITDPQEGVGGRHHHNGNSQLWLSGLCARRHVKGCPQFSHLVFVSLYEVGSILFAGNKHREVKWSGQVHTTMSHPIRTPCPTLSAVTDSATHPHTKYLLLYGLWSMRMHPGFQEATLCFLTFYIEVFGTYLHRAKCTNLKWVA